MCDMSLFSDPMTGYLWSARLNILLAILTVLRKGRWRSFFWMIAGCVWIAQSVFLLWAHGLSFLSGIPFTFTFAGLLLCFCQLCCLKKDGDSCRLRPCLTGFFLIFLAVFSIFPEERRLETYMMSFVYAKIFFLSRPPTLALALFALSSIADALNGENDVGGKYINSIKQTAMLAATFFLCGEIAGCYWGFIGWGTTWRWSGNFFWSAMIFVLFMVSLHVPRSTFPSFRAQTWATCIPLTLIVAAMILSKLVRI